MTKLKSPEVLLIVFLILLSIVHFIYFFNNGLGLAYNDARSHLNISRRVVEGLKPGLAQLGSVWLPLPHILTAITVWHDFMWHSGLAGSIVSMISYVVTGYLVYLFLKDLKVSLLGRIVGLLVYALNGNVLYLQSTAMTELLLLATMTYGCLSFFRWYKSNEILSLIKSAFWIMLSTLVRYDGWFLLAFALGLIILKFLFPIRELKNLKNIISRYKKTEGTVILFSTLAGFGVFLWLLWNLLIFKDPLYFAFGPFSAKAQQDQLESASILVTKHNWFKSIEHYTYAMVYNSYALVVIMGFLGFLTMMIDSKISRSSKLGILPLISPLLFNILALYLGHSVLFIQGLSGQSWFNVRYGVMLIPALGVFIGYFVSKISIIRLPIIGILIYTLLIAFISKDAVTIDDARVGSSQKNVAEVSGWLRQNALDRDGFVLISAASHDAIIFTSGLHMSRFIHEGTGLYWESATTVPDRWAKWIIMRTYDNNDLTWKHVKETEGFKKYDLINHFPFADIYELKAEYDNQLNYSNNYFNQR